MEDYLHRKLKIQAATDSNTINEVVNEAVKMYLHNKCKNIQAGNNTQCTQTIYKTQITINAMNIIFTDANYKFWKLLSW